MLLMKPGGMGPLISLQEARRQSYEALRESHNATVRARLERGIPLDDFADPDWLRAKVSEAASAVEAQDFAHVRALARDLLEGASVSSGEWEPYVPKETLAGINVRLRSISAELRADLLGLGAEVSRSVESLSREAARERLLKDVELSRVQAKFVAHALAYIDGLTVLDDEGKEAPFSASAGPGEAIGEDVLEMLHDAGLMLDLFVVCRDFQGLTPKQRGHYGQQAPSI